MRACSREWIQRLRRISGATATEKNEVFEVGNKRRTPIMKVPKISGADALAGHTRSHPEHDG